MKTLLLAFLLGATQAFTGETIRVAIGTQDTTINCAAGGPVVRELKLLEKYLPRDGKYKDAEYEITWLNLPTGAQLNSEILANRLDIVSMADFPSIVGHDAFLTQNNGVKTIYIASLSSGLQGAGNALLVPETSTVQNIKELKGKTVSVPFASTAHAFLLRAVKDQKDFVTGEEVIDAKKAGQIWVDGEKKVRLYKDVPSTFIALNQLEKDGKTVRVAFVHDRETGLKLFADKVWYIRKDNDIAAFLEKSGAEKWAQANNGNLLTYAEARKFVSGERLAQAR